ncbi:MAG TPA: MFS transporter [Longimicrobiaceae bacterium]|nr:MFS transporter [Longimicrobiaceae bacterium]
MKLPNPWRGLRGLPAEVWVVAGATLANRMGTMVLPFLVLYLTQHLGHPARTAGLVLTVYGVGGLVSAPVAGRLCDRVGALRVMQAALLLSGGVLFVFPLVRGIEAVLGLTLLLALIGEAVRPASLAVLTGSVAPEKRAAAIALNRLAVNLGMSVGPAVGGFLAMASFPLLFVVDGATSLLAGIGLTLAIRRLGLLRREDRAAEAGALAGTAPGGAMRDGRLMLFLAGFFLLGVVFLQHEGAMAVYLVRDLGLPPSFYGTLFALNTLVIVALEVPLNLAMAGWPHRRALVLGALLCAAGFGALGLATGPWTVAATVLVWTFGEMVFFPVSATYVAELAPPGRRGAYMGAYSMSFGLAFTVGPAAGTAALDRFGAPTLWAAVFAVGLASAAVMAALGRPSPALTPVPARR